MDVCRFDLRYRSNAETITALALAPLVVFSGRRFLCSDPLKQEIFVLTARQRAGR